MHESMFVNYLALCRVSRRQVRLFISLGVYSQTGAHTCESEVHVADFREPKAQSRAWCPKAGRGWTFTGGGPGVDARQ